MNIDDIIKRRKTQKVLADKPLPTDSEDDFRLIIDDLLDLAAAAPYHYRCHKSHTADEELTSCLPYRFYVLTSEKCRATAQYIQQEGIPSGKIINMLYAAEALFIVTWLPEPSEINQDGDKSNLSFEGNLVNMEHISATSAAIQNILLGATARDIPNYWSTGGKLRSLELKTYLGVPQDEIIAGTIFLFPKELSDLRVFEGKFRNEGKEKNTWSKWVK